MAVMPITVGAIRKVRADKRKQAQNLTVKKAYKKAVLAIKKKTTEKNLALAFSKMDKAVKSGVIHRNKAARLKSRLSVLVRKKRS
jgi:small subunit ribosomal protein S20